ncbi:MAG TPA: hypothetical protein VK549_10015, partial [Acidimicrobiia bacterium]|nr:hypothetical protein [Acidimicrobiia bacterium]
AGLLTSPDVQTWRASLDADPFAAMQLRHDLAAVEHGTASTHALATCAEMVRRGALIEQCGAPVDADGTCSSGHRAG